jgi:hypothetical protein
MNHDLNNKFWVENNFQGKKGEISYANMCIPSGNKSSGKLNAISVFLKSKSSTREIASLLLDGLYGCLYDYIVI